MQVNIQVYAKLKDFFKPKIKLELNEGSTLQDLFIKLVQLNPDSEKSLNTSKAAVNDEFVDYKYILKENENILLFPPVSGG
ncbi:MAG: MoaD/ThiS family protein [Spirochaetota bacterium]|nr:MoaD/ThiS family protein [Spirochaetota bacterium]